MNRNFLMTLAITIITGALVLWLLLDSPEHGEHANGGHGNETEIEDVVKGPHRGRLLVDGAFALEIAIYETGIPPEFHVYAYDNNELVAPEKVNLIIELTRLSGKTDQFKFKAQGDYLRGSGVVTEPHSFDVNIVAEYQGKTHHWSYENYEGRTQILETMANEAGIKTEKAGPAIITEILPLTGRVQADPNRISRVRPRFPGVVQSVRRDLGDVVRRGDVLATVQSNESLQTYSVKAPIAGSIIKRDIQIGESTGEDPLFVIADLSQVWVELDVFGRDLNRVQMGQAVEVESFDGKVMQGKIEWVSPLAEHASQSVHARVPLPNQTGKLRPGQFVRGHVTVAKHSVPLAVRQSAIQGFRDFQVVFARFGEIYEVRMLELGRSNREWVEVTGGLALGTEYVTENSYLLKADIEKSGASHDH